MTSIEQVLFERAQRYSVQAISAALNCPVPAAIVPVSYIDCMAHFEKAGALNSFGAVSVEIASGKEFAEAAA